MSERTVIGAVPEGPLLVVSPHFDDAVFSCFALLDRAEPVDVLTVCGGAPEPARAGWWDVRCGFASSDESVAARRSEDEAAFAGTPHAVSYLDLLELQHLEGPRTSDDERAIAAAVTSWTAAARRGTVALPAGAGAPARWRRWPFARLRRGTAAPPQHPDHVYVRDAALRALAGSADGTPLLYEEVPYLWSRPAPDEAERVARAWGVRAEPLVLDVDRARKAARIASYASQIEHISPPHRRLDDAGTLPRAERYWRLERPRSSS